MLLQAIIRSCLDGYPNALCLTSFRISEIIINNKEACNAKDMSRKATQQDSKLKQKCLQKN